jgi:hypothetical protein
MSTMVCCTFDKNWLFEENSRKTHLISGRVSNGSAALHTNISIDSCIQQKIC